MWSNYDLTKRFLQEIQKKEVIQKPTKTTPDIAEIIETEHPKAQAITKFQNKFIKDFKAMLDNHKRRNVALYRLTLLTKLQRLKAERARRLEAVQPQVSAKRDLFS
jgi:hypothetical protein